MSSVERGLQALHTCEQNHPAAQEQLMDEVMVSISLFTDQEG